MKPGISTNPFCLEQTICKLYYCTATGYSAETSLIVYKTFRPVKNNSESSMNELSNLLEYPIIYTRKFTIINHALEFVQLDLFSEPGPGGEQNTNGPGQGLIMALRAVVMMKTTTKIFLIAYLSTIAFVTDNYRRPGIILGTPSKLGLKLPIKILEKNIWLSVSNDYKLLNRIFYSVFGTFRGCTHQTHTHTTDTIVSCSPGPAGCTCMNISGITIYHSLCFNKTVL